MRTRAVAALAVLVAAGASAVPAGAQGLDATCTLALTKFDGGTTNALYPDDSARYWSGNFTSVPGTEIRLSGQFPHARYISFNVYDAALRPVDALADAELTPDAGSSNPFLAGADRTVAKRAYTARISFDTPPARRATNTMYANAGEPNPAGVFTYRLYIPDDGRDEFGGVGLPTAEAVSAGTNTPVPPSVCSQVSKPEVAGINELFAGAPSIPQAEPAATGTGRTPPHWRKFVNVASSLGSAVTDNPSFDSAGQAQLDTAGGSGGFLSNRHNAYVSALTNRSFGQVLVTRFRAPSFPDTRHGAARMGDGQLRYWSLCENDAPTQRVIACLNDDRAVVGADGFATFVVSTPNERPANAKAACGVNWLPWGADTRGALILRHMLPSASFMQAIQRATADREVATMGDFFPVSTYYANAAAYEKRGCATAAAAAPPRTCASRRHFTVHLPGGVTAVTLDGKRLKVRGRTVVVDLRPRARAVVRLRIHRRSGRTQTRTYHPCTRRGR